MSAQKLERIIGAWRERRKVDDDTPESRRAIEIPGRTLGLLAEGKPISSSDLAVRLHLSAAEAQSYLDYLRDAGTDFDADGNIVGMALSLKPTRYAFTIDGRELYAWCALDTLFLPGIIGNTAEVETTCPVTGYAIRLTVTPVGISRAEPAGAVLSVVTPGVTPETGPGCQSGPQGPICGSMHFFKSAHVVSSWLRDHPGIDTLALDEAFELASNAWIEPWTKVRGAGFYT